jgi:hypothetical protein
LFGDLLFSQLRLQFVHFLQYYILEVGISVQLSRWQEMGEKDVVWVRNGVTDVDGDAFNFAKSQFDEMGLAEGVWPTTFA